jgi:hypothetical protein
MFGLFIIIIIIIIIIYFLFLGFFKINFSLKKLKLDALICIYSIAIFICFFI